MNDDIRSNRKPLENGFQGLGEQVTLRREVVSNAGTVAGTLVFETLGNQSR